MPMLNISWEPLNASRSSCVGGSSCSSCSIDLMRFCCCQIQLFQSFSATSFHIAGRGAGLKRSRTVFLVTILKAISVSFEANPCQIRRVKYRVFPMLARLFLGFSLVGAEWVLYLLLVLSVLSVAIIFERILFYRQASHGLREFRDRVRAEASGGDLKNALEAARRRSKPEGAPADLESQMAVALLANGRGPAEVLNEVAQDPVVRARLAWERNLSVLATIGSNAPFVGLFGTVLGIIKAFHDLSQQGNTGASQVTAGISEALVATAVGLLVATPAVVAFNFFQRKVKAALAEAEALKSFLVGKLAE